MSAHGWDRMEAPAWAAMVEVLEGAGLPWPRELRLLHLRVLQGQVVTGLRRELPSCRELAVQWRVGKSTAAADLAAEAEWADPHRAAAWAKKRPGHGADKGRTRAGHRPDKRRTPGQGSSPASEREPDTDRTEPGHEPDTSRTQTGHAPTLRTPHQTVTVTTHTATAPPRPPAEPAERVPEPEVIDLEARRRTEDRAQLVALIVDDPSPTVDLELQPVRQLAAKLRRPAMDVLREVAVVAAWARLAAEPGAARHIRGDGWAGRGDHSRSLRTLADPARWAERHRAAVRWRESMLDRDGRLVRANAEQAWAFDGRTPPSVFAALLGVDLAEEAPSSASIRWGCT